jgi:hypothetical protein
VRAYDGKLDDAYFRRPEKIVKMEETQEPDSDVTPSHQANEET